MHSGAKNIERNRKDPHQNLPPKQKLHPRLIHLERDDFRTDPEPGTDNKAGHSRHLSPLQAITPWHHVDFHHAIICSRDFCISQLFRSI